MKKWTILSEDRRQKTEERIIEILLKNRGIKTKKEIKEFLNPPNPYKLTAKDLGINPKEVIKAIKKYKGIYFLTFAGCGALLTKYVKRARPVAYKDLGAEAIYELKVKEFPLIVGIDTKGRDIYAKK